MILRKVAINHHNNRTIFPIAHWCNLLFNGIVVRTAPGSIMAWFEEEEFWRELYPYMFPAERLAVAARQVEQILALTNFKGQTVLDLCCGPGRHAVEFARRGFGVTGVDRSQFLLERARERGAEAGVTVEWVAHDMRRFRRPAAFDLACNLFTSFGYFDQGENRRVLRGIHGNLAAGGILVMEMLGKERLSRVWQNALCAEYGDGALLLQRPEVRDDWSRVHNSWTLMKNGRYRTYEFDHAIYSGSELKNLLLGSGFAQVNLYGSFEGEAYGVEALRLIAVAKKADE
jgi:SAM-dependent methyltransferase